MGSWSGFKVSLFGVRSDTAGRTFNVGRYIHASPCEAKKYLSVNVLFLKIVLSKGSMSRRKESIHGRNDSRRGA